MAIEKIQAQIITEVDDQSLKQSWDKVKMFARDTWKELDKSFLFKLQLDKANTKLQLESARGLLRQAKKDWDKEMILKYTIKTDELQSKLTEAWRKLNNFKNTWEQSVSRLSRLFGGLTDQVWVLISKLWALAVGAGLMAIWKQALMLWDKLEQANISFTTMLWSEEEAKNLLEDLTIFASNTPFELVWLRDTAKQLLAFGIESEQMIPTMKALWDVSSWLSVPIDRIAYAYWQVRVAWRLMGQDLMQFTNAWVPLIAELAKNMWVAENKIKDMVSAGEIGFADVQKAFKTMTEDGGRFANLMAKQSDTLSGKWSNLKDQADAILESIGTAMIPFAKKVVSALSWALNWLVNMWTWLRAITTLIVSGIVQSIFTVQKAWKTVAWNLQILFNGFVGSLRDFGANFWVFTRNVKAVFQNIPTFIWEALNKGIEKIENFLNKVTWWVNAFAKKLWYEWELVSGVSLWRIDLGAEKKALEEYKDLNSKAAAEKNYQIMKEMEEYQDSRDELKSMEAERLRDELLALANSNNKKKELDTELKDTIISNNNEATENAKWNAKILEDLQKKELEREKKFQAYLEENEEKRKKRDEERAKRIEKGTEIIQDYYWSLRDEIDKTKDKLDDFDDKIEESQKKIQDLKNDLAWEKQGAGVELAERKTEVEDKIRELEQEFAGIKGLTRLSDETLKSIWESTLWGGASWNQVLEVKKLYAELDFLKQNSALLTEEAIKEASESESEAIVRKLNEKEAEIQKEIELEEQRLNEFETQKAKEQEIYDALDKYRTTLEYNYTALLKQEVAKRIDELEAMRIKAIETAQAMASAWITTNNTSTTIWGVSINVDWSWSPISTADAIAKTFVDKVDKANKWIND